MNSGAGAVAALTASDANLGLTPGQVELRDHDPRWAELFATTAEHLTDAVQDLGARVEHIGSTAVPGLAAKPILDIAVGAPAPVDTAVYVSRLEAAGFRFQTDLGSYGGLLFLAADESDQVLSHLHVVDIDDFQWRWYLGFRDALRSDAALRGEYEQLKRQSAGKHAADREQYTQAKFDWVLDTVQSLDAALPNAATTGAEPTDS